MPTFFIWTQFFFLFVSFYLSVKNDKERKTFLDAHDDKNGIAHTFENKSNTFFV